MHFYELREGDDDVFTDILLVREDEVEPEEFFELVQGIRKRIIDHFEHRSLAEAIADELERMHEFVAITDDRLTASVNVSREEEDNYLADLDDVSTEGVDYKAVLADFDPSGNRPN